MAATRAIPRLSIGLPVYNGERFLAEAIDVLLGQTYTDFELVISDNASTDATAEICRRYQDQDARVRYIHQPRNLGLVGNHNFLVGVARGELFKWASHDDRYAADYLERCVATLDEHPEAVLVHAWCSLVDEAGGPIELIKYPEAMAARGAPERLHAMLYDGMGDWIYGVIRTAVLRQTPLHATYHAGERTLVTELALHGTLLQIPEALYIRRDHPNRALSPRERSVVLDPRRASRLRHPAVRLYAEYLWGYVSAIARAPLTDAERRKCYAILAGWLPSRALPARQIKEGTSLDKQPLLYLARRLTGLVARHGGRPTARINVGFIGLLGSGNLGNDASLESVLRYLQDHRPELTVDAMCKGPDEVTARYGIPAMTLNWYQRYERTASGVDAALLKLLGKGVDVFRTAWWVRRHDVVIVPGMGTMEASLLLKPWWLPYSLFLACGFGRISGTKVAFVSVGAGSIKKRVTRWLLDTAARLAFYRSYRDTPSREAMRDRGVDVSSDRVYPDLVFGLPAPTCPPGDPEIVGVGIMDYNGSNDDRSHAEAIRNSYEKAVTTFVRWLLDQGRCVRLFIGQTGGPDEAVVARIMADVEAQRPDQVPGRLTFETTATFSEVMEAMAPVGTVVATRFHNVIAALRLGKPVIALGYSPKFMALMTEMGLGEFCQSAKSLDVDLLVTQFNDLEKRQAELRQGILARNAEFERGVAEQFSELSAVLLPAKESSAGPIE